MSPRPDRHRWLLAWGIMLLAVLATAPQAAARQSGAIEVTGATYAEYDASTGLWTIRGSPVVVTRGRTRLEAAEVVLDEARGRATASGGVTVRHEDLTLQASRVEVRLAEEAVAATGEVVVTQAADAPLRLTAGRVEALLAARRVDAGDGPVLTHREARLAAERLIYDGRARTVLATGGAVLTLREGRLTAARMEADLAGQTFAGDGGVEFAGDGLVVASPRVRADRGQNVAIFSGGAVARRGGDVLTAETVTVDLRTRRVVASGSPRLVIAPRSDDRSD